MIYVMFFLELNTYIVTWQMLPMVEVKHHKTTWVICRRSTQLNNSTSKWVYPPTNAVLDEFLLSQFFTEEDQVGQLSFHPSPPQYFYQERDTISR